MSVIVLHIDISPITFEKFYLFNVKVIEVERTEKTEILHTPKYAVIYLLIYFCQLKNHVITIF